MWRRFHERRAGKRGAGARRTHWARASNLGVCVLRRVRRCDRTRARRSGFAASAHSDPPDVDKRKNRPHAGSIEDCRSLSLGPPALVTRPRRAPPDATSAPALAAGASSGAASPSAPAWNEPGVEGRGCVRLRRIVRLQIEQRGVWPRCNNSNPLQHRSRGGAIQCLTQPRTRRAARCGTLVSQNQRLIARGDFHCSIVASTECVAGASAGPHISA